MQKERPKAPEHAEAPAPEERTRRPEHEVRLEKGQEVIVQIIKEPVGKKGVRVTSEVSLAGRFLVLLPFDGKIGISKKVTNFREKRRLRKIVQAILPEGFGVIIRTVAEGKEETSLKNDLEDLIKTWREIETERQEREGALPALQGPRDDIKRHPRPLFK